MKIHKLAAKPISYDSKKRKRKDIKYIVIHYTGNYYDTAKNNATYFSTSNIRQAGAHFFVDKKGIVYKSVKLNRTAWSVGGLYSLINGAGAYYGKCTNYNSVSIELCDCIKTYSKKQADVTKKLIKHIQKYCPNATTIIRHWDVNGKQCPLPMVGSNNTMWKKFKTEIS